MIEELHCVQAFKDEIWRTFYVTSYGPDAEATYQDIKTVSQFPLRLVVFVVKGVDFIATQAHDFKVLARTE
jgi:hypothetical protein